MDNIQRELLWLLHSLHANLVKDDSTWHRQQAKAYRYGITCHYGDNELPAELSEEVQRETQDILNMFGWLDNMCERLGADESLKRELSYEGFDGNNDEHAMYVSFLRGAGRYDELNLELNSHSRGTLPKYRRMLSVFRHTDKSKPTLDDLQAIANAQLP